MSSAPVLESVADPVRLRVLRHLAEQGPATLGELAAAAEVHPNTVRAHLADVEARGIIVRGAGPPHGRGRPPVRFRLADGWRLPSTDFSGLAQVLAAAVLRAGISARELRAVGRQWGRLIMENARESELEREIPRALEQLGFQGRVSGCDVVLSGCACPLVSRERPELVCQLVTAVVEGMAQAAGTDLAPDSSAHDPESRVCHLHLASAARASSPDRRRHDSDRRP
jgi:predicted ArsR family transcriptional regulator